MAGFSASSRIRVASVPANPSVHRAFSGIPSAREFLREVFVFFRRRNLRQFSALPLPAFAEASAGLGILLVRRSLGEGEREGRTIPTKLTHIRLHVNRFGISSACPHCSEFEPPAAPGRHSLIPLREPCRRDAILMSSPFTQVAAFLFFFRYFPAGLLSFPNTHTCAPMERPARARTGPRPCEQATRIRRASTWLLSSATG